MTGRDDARQAHGRRGSDIEAAAALLRERLGQAPEVVLVTGSGLGHLADAVEEPVTVPFDDLPGFPAAGVAGHSGAYVGGRWAGRRVLIQGGRFHAYEGHPLSVVTAPVRVARALGTRVLVLTNAAGGIHPTLEAGDLVLLDDHINLMGAHPLVGPVAQGEERFPDMSAPYDAELQAVAVEAAARLGVPLVRGVYAAVSGPSYETPAEIRMLGALGADIVGMSTVPEVITARASGLRCLAFSVVTNKAAGLSHGTLGHEEVLEVGRRAGRALGRLLEAVLKSLPAGFGDPGPQESGAK